MNRKEDRMELLKERISPYMGTVKFFLGLVVALLSLFLYLYQPAQGTVLSRKADAQAQQLEVTREEIARVSIRLSDQITLDKVRQYAQENGLQFGGNANMRLIWDSSENDQTAMRR